MSASMQYSQPYVQQQPVHYAQASQPVTYGAPRPAPAHTLGSQMAPDWGASGVPMTSMYSMPQAAVPMGSVSVPQMTYAAAPAYSAAPAHSGAAAVFTVDPAALHPVWARGAGAGAGAGGPTVAAVTSAASSVAKVSSKKKTKDAADSSS
eukprot:CAMPEP_0177432112 /NCGR_PEP_ID=MMETSP0368-20130122/76528_1 /TAXON_ID=447022 ORGANISM="Scrippsiella hangoei-like, Strain SHHI-4" /NCGR_SAMPLE_ID=MMETSP0368 /ASSEMBLY_ACC=CAM_ASM_000363 /LENGTH=149 /DNA_ID=CAMNT_0018902775 /DNA_START=61 /DNA_END=508 /DNA_ORIENTATION=+